MVRSMLLLGALLATVVFSSHSSAQPGKDGPPSLKAPLASVSVDRGRSLAIGKLDDRCLIHTNRPYFFTKVPGFLRGVPFTSHQHKNPSTVSCEVKSGGRLYLCLDHETNPKDLDVPESWRHVGTMESSDGGKWKFTWNVYETMVKPSQKLSFPSMDRWGSVVAARIDMSSGPPAARPQKAPAQPGGDEFSQLSREIATYRAGRHKHQKRYELLESQTFHKEALIRDADRDPVDVVLRRTRALLSDIRRLKGVKNLSSLAGQFDRLDRENASTQLTDSAARRKLFDRACTLRRAVAFCNPLLDFDKIIFLTHHKARYHHMCDQYFGFHAVPGGGVYVISDPFGEKPVVRDVLEDAVVANGRLKGQRLSGRGSFISLDLNYDGKTMLFAWTEAARTVSKWTPQSTYHVFEAAVDGSMLRQLTDGNWNDFDPVYLPNGRLAFISERRGGFLRCGGRPDPTYTLHGMMADGSDIIPLSSHETHEWHPSVDNEGMIVYTRWDYVDRDSDIAHHLWHTTPDGRDPRSFHGNYPGSRESRPWMEMSIRAVPGSHRYVAVSTPHHGQAYGSMVMLDLRQPDDNAMSQVKRLTPEVLLPESESAPGAPHGRGTHKPRAEVYGTPWPLSENYHLCVYDPGQRRYGIYLVDVFGNRELVYRDPSVPCLDPIPLRARTRPRVLPTMTRLAKADRVGGGPGADKATIGVVDVYDADFKWPEATKIKALRIIQLFPKTTPAANKPNISMGNQSLARGVVGTVPVEADGSAYFEAPVNVPIYFQALDEHGMAVQSMRSATYVKPGERLVCQGCHERKQGALPSKRTSAHALQRAPSRIRKDVDGSYPLSYPRLVQSVLDRNCVTCHEKNVKKKAPDLTGSDSGKYGWSRSYRALAPRGYFLHGGNGWIKKNPGGGARSIAGKVGAHGSKLYQMLARGHNKLKLSREDMYRITLWLDCNSNYYGAYHDEKRQSRGEIVMPELE
ncbi:MAG: HzsA-related protein [Planctomycetota bacterium]|jgi:hypothetical protein